MGKLNSLGGVAVKITADTKGHDRAIDQSERKIKGMAAVSQKSLTAVGNAWKAYGLSAGAAIGVVSTAWVSGVKAATDWEQRTLRTEALIKSTGGAAGFTAKELAKMAKERDLATLGDKDNILDAINTLQTFKSVSGETFERTIILAQDLASTIGGDIKTSTLQLGKALQEPLKGISALTRSGVSFSEEQKEQIKNLVEQNELYKAQQIILDEIEGQVGGAGEAEAAGLAGKLDTLSFQWRELREEFADTKAAVDGIEALIAVVVELREALPKVKKVYEKNPGTFWGGGFLGFLIGEKGRVQELKDVASGLRDINGELIALPHRSIGKIGNQPNEEEREVLVASVKLHEIKVKTRSVIKDTTKEIYDQSRVIDVLYQKQAGYLRELDSGNNGFLNLEIDGESFRVTEAEIDNLLEGLDKLKKEAKETGISLEDMFSELKTIGQDHTALFLTDALRGELDSFEDYMGSFTRSLQSAWGDMVAQMIFEWKAIEGLSMAGSFGVMGAIGGGLALAGGLFGGGGGPSEHELAMKEWSRSLDEINNRLAELTMTQAEYSIHKLNQDLNEFGIQAAKAGQSTEKLIELRKEETAALIEQSRQRYTDINDSIDQWLVNLVRKDWEADDWQTRLDQIGTELTGLDPNASDYENRSIELLNEQFDVLKQIYGVQTEHLSLYKDSQKSVNQKIWDVANTGSAPMAVEAHQDRYDSLLTKAKEGDNDATGDLLGFVNPYMSAMTSVGTDTTSLRKKVVADLSGLSTSITTSIEDEEKKKAEEAARKKAAEIAAREAAERAKAAAAAAAKQAAYNRWKATKPAPTAAIPGLWLGKTSYIGMHQVDPQVHAWAGSMMAHEASVKGWWNNAPRDMIPDSKEATMNQYIGWLNSMPNAYARYKLYNTSVGQKAWRTWASQSHPNMPTFSHGGLMTGPSIGGEAGNEWAVPSHESPYNAGFLKSVGADPAKIAAEVVARIGGGGPIHINLHMDGRKIAETVVEQTRKNGQVKRALVRELS